MNARGRSGFSLLETLVAAAVAAVLALIVFTLVRTIRDVREAQRGADEGPAAAVTAAGLLARDLACGFPAEEDELKLWLATTNVAGVASSSLRMTTFARAPGEEDLAWAEPVRVEWRLLAGADGKPALARISRTLSQPRSSDPAVTNLVVAPVAVFDVRLTDAKETVSTWSPKERKALPVSAEIRIAPPGGEDAPVVVKGVTPAGAKVPRTRGKPAGL